MEHWLELFNTYRVPAQHLVSFLLAGAIWRWGGAPERWLICIFLATMVLPIYVIWGFDLGSMVAGTLLDTFMVIDALATFLFVSVALNANRNYPLWIAGFQLVAIGAHLVRVMVESASPLAYAILIIGPSYCQLLVLAVGFVRHVLRERRFGPYREWREAAPFARRLQI